ELTIVHDSRRCVGAEAVNGVVRAVVHAAGLSFAAAGHARIVGAQGVRRAAEGRHPRTTGLAEAAALAAIAGARRAQSAAARAAVGDTGLAGGAAAAVVARPVLAAGLVGAAAGLAAAGAAQLADTTRPPVVGAGPAVATIAVQAGIVGAAGLPGDAASDAF